MLYIAKSMSGAEEWGRSLDNSIVPPQFTRWYCFLFSLLPGWVGTFFINPICMGMWSRKIPGKKHESCHCSTMLLYCTLVPTGQAGSGLTKPYPGALIFLAGHVGFPSNFWTELNENKREETTLKHGNTQFMCMSLRLGIPHMVDQCWTMLNISRLFKATSEKIARVN